MLTGVGVGVGVGVGAGAGVETVESVASVAAVTLAAVTQLLLFVLGAMVTDCPTASAGPDHVVLLFVQIHVYVDPFWSWNSPVVEKYFM